MTLNSKELLEGVTPGDWEAVRCGPASPKCWNVQAQLGLNAQGIRTIRTIDQVLDFCGPEEAEANARLIASAPRLARRVIDLEEALNLVRNTVGDLKRGFASSVDPSRWVEQLQAVIDAALTIQGEAK